MYIIMYFEIRALSNDFAKEFRGFDPQKWQGRTRAYHAQAIQTA